MHTPPISSGRVISGTSCGDAAERQRDRDHGDPDRDDIGFEQVRGHSGAVADIVADVVGDHRRVARIVLGNPGFDLADQVGADVGGLGEDAAAETGEDRHQRCAERERGQSGHDRAVIGRVAAGAGQIPEEARNREQRQSGHQHAGDGAGAEGGGEAFLEAAAGGLGGADVGPHRNIHADEAGGARQDRTDQESDGREPAEKDEDQDRDDNADDGDRGILAARDRRGRPPGSRLRPRSCAGFRPARASTCWLVTIPYSTAATPQAIAIKSKFIGGLSPFSRQTEWPARRAQPEVWRPFMRRGARLQLRGLGGLVEQQGRGHSGRESAKCDQPLAKRNCRDVHGPISPAMRTGFRR